MKFPVRVDFSPRIPTVTSLRCMKIATCTICFTLVLVTVYRVLNDIHEISGGISIRNNAAVESTTLIHQLHNFPKDDELMIDKLKLDLVHPTNEPYRLDNPLPEEHVLAREVRQINRLKRGFFLEIGAGDGEYRSPTLCLETEDGWSGMLIEVDPGLGSQLKEKKRKAIVSISCVGSSNFSYVGYLWQKRVMPPDWEGPVNYSGDDLMVLETSCYPIYSFLEAADVRAVDFLTVNINGGELAVLKTVPWGKARIKIVAVKLQEPKMKESFTTYMSDVGYTYRNLYDHMEESFLLFVSSKTSRNSS